MRAPTRAKRIITTALRFLSECLSSILGGWPGWLSLHGIRLGGLPLTGQGPDHKKGQADAPGHRTQQLSIAESGLWGKLEGEIGGFAGFGGLEAGGLVD